MACQKISIIKLISTPEKYHNKCVETVGFFSMELERNWIYLNKDSYDYSLKENGINHNFLSVIIDSNPEDVVLNLSKVHEGKVVRLKGKFDMYKYQPNGFIDVLEVKLVDKASKAPTKQ